MWQDRQCYMYVELLLFVLESTNPTSTTDQGKTISVLLMDRCEACAIGDLNFSPHAFNQFAESDVGRISNISWVIID